MTKNQIFELLKTIKYPGFNRDIISFGMVIDIIVDENQVEIILNISSQNDEKCFNDIPTIYLVFGLMEINPTRNINTMSLNILLII